MKNLVMALMMLLVLGTGYLLGSQQTLTDDPMDIFELTKNTSNNVNNQNLNGNLNKSKGEYKTIDNQKYDIEDNSSDKSNKENDEIVSNKSINQKQTNENDSDSKEEDSDKKENIQSIKSIS